MIIRFLKIIACLIATFAWLAPIGLITMCFSVVYFPLKYIITGNSSFEDDEENLISLVMYPFDKLFNDD